MQKSKILAMLLVVAMIASFVVVPASANAAPTYCQHCQQNISDWTALEGTIESYTFTSSGHYYLSGNAQPTAGKFLQIYGDGVKVCLDLNGYTLTAAEGQRTIQAFTKAEFAIMDSSAAKTGKVTGNGVASGGEAGLVRVSSAGTKVYVYGGTFTGGTVSDESGKGGGFFVNRGTELHIKGGVITGNSAFTGGNIYVANHGALYVSGDALIKDGVANSSSGTGGNIAAVGAEKSGAYENPTVEIFGNAQVIGGSANVGGNIEVLGATIPTSVSFNDYHATLKIYGNAQVIGGTITKPGKTIPYCVRVNNYSYATVSENAYVEAMLLTASTNTTVEGGFIDTLHVRAGNSSHNIYGGYIGVLCGNNHGMVTIHNGYIGEVYGGSKTIGEYSGSVDTIAAPAVIDTDALVLDAGETAKIYYHEAGACADCGVTYTGDLDLNGMTVTVPAGKTLDASVGGNIIDSVGGGKLVGAALFNDENAMLPITTADGIVFEEVAIEQDFAAAYTAGDATAKYAFYFDVAAANTKLDEAVAAGTATIDVYVKWNNGTADVEDIFVLDAATAAEFAEAATWDASMIVLNLAGLTNVTLLECAVRVTSNGVTLQ